MTPTWSTVPLHAVLKRAKETTAAPLDGRYSQITVKLWGRGVVQRRAASGATVTGGRRFVARAGQLILSRIDARNGAIGIVPKELDGSIVSNDFPLFDVNPNRLHPAFLGWLSRTLEFVELCRRASEGTTNRVRLQEERFLELEIRLPPLAEQRRIAAQIEDIATKVREVCRLREEVRDGLDLLARTILFSDESAVPTPMHELVTLREPDTAVQPDGTYEFAGVYSFGRGVFRGQVRLGIEFAYPRLTRLREGDLVYPKLMAWEGAFGVVPPECSDLFVSTEFPVFEVNRERVLPDAVDTYFRTPSVWPEVSGASTGTNVRRRRLNPRTFLTFRMPLPSRDVQNRICRVRRAGEVTRRLQDEADAAIGALLPSILHKAFKGEL